MHLEYEVKFIDNFKFQIAHHFFSKTYQAMNLIVPSLIFFTNYFSQDYQYPLWVNLATAVIIYFAQLILIVLFLFLYCLFKRDHIVLTKQILEISELGMHSSNKYSQELYHWNKRIKVIEKLGNICIYVSANMAIIIPNRVFKTQQQLDELVSFVIEMRDKSDF